MAENVNEKLFSEFAPNTTQEWKDKVIADLKGADFDKKAGLENKRGFQRTTDVPVGGHERPQELRMLPGRISFRER